MPTRLTIVVECEDRPVDRDATLSRGLRATRILSALVQALQGATLSPSTSRVEFEIADPFGRCAGSATLAWVDTDED